MAMSDEHHQRVEQTASAIEDLLQMGLIMLDENNAEKALLSPQFSQVLSNVRPDIKVEKGSENDQVMKMMYYSLLIYMNENLRMPRSLMMALGNDLETNRDNMESGELITRYVSILAELWTRNLADGASK